MTPIINAPTSKADAPAETISTPSIEAKGKQVVFRCLLKYNTTKIDPKNTDAVRAAQRL